MNCWEKGREGTFLHHGLCLERTGGAPREGALCAELAASRCGAVYVMRVGACVCVLQKGQSCCDVFVVVCCLLEWWVCYRGLYTRGEPEQSPWDGEGQGGTAGPMPLLCRHWPRARPRRRGGALSRVKKRGPRGLWAREVLVAGGFVVLSSLAKKEANACKEERVPESS